MAGGRFRILIFLVAAAVVGCQAPAGGVRVSGKIVADGRGMEGAAVVIHRAGEEAGNPVRVTGSVYHGTFTVRLPPGEYRLRASHTLRLRDSTVTLAGSAVVRVPEGVKRVDRVVIELEPE